MTPEQTLAYVAAAAQALDLPLDGERLARVAEHLERTAAMAQMLESLELPAETEIAEIYCPMPFPPASNLLGVL